MTCYKRHMVHTQVCGGTAGKHSGCLVSRSLGDPQTWALNRLTLQAGSFLYKLCCLLPYQ